MVAGKDGSDAGIIFVISRYGGKTEIRARSYRLSLVGRLPLMQVPASVSADSGAACHSSFLFHFWLISVLVCCLFKTYENAN